MRGTLLGLLACGLLTGSTSSGHGEAAASSTIPTEDRRDATYRMTCDGLAPDGFSVTFADGAATVLTDSFSFNESTFVERLAELLPPVESVAPGFIGRDRDAWIKAVKSARNLEAHRFVTKKAQREKHDERTDEYYQLAVSTEWVLSASSCDSA